MWYTVVEYMDSPSRIAKETEDCCSISLFSGCENAIVFETVAVGPAQFAVAA